MKKPMSLTFLGFLLIAASPSVPGQDAYSTNADGSVYAYTTNADGSANIAGYSGPPWVVTIPSNINGLNVTSLGYQAFYENDSLTSVTIPGGVTTIGASAFLGCFSLASVSIPDSVTSVGEYAFNLCRSLASVTIPGSITNISQASFSL